MSSNNAFTFVNFRIGCTFAVYAGRSSGIKTSLRSWSQSVYQRFLRSRVVINIARHQGLLESFLVSSRQHMSTLLFERFKRLLEQFSAVLSVG